jgi:hypothetical protein
MSTILHLTSDFIERMCDPAFGLDTNETYAMRYAKASESPGFDERMDEAIQTLTATSRISKHSNEGEVMSTENTGIFSMHGWLWVLRRAQLRKLKMNEDLMLNLIKNFPSILIASVVVETMSRAHADSDIMKAAKDIKASAWFLRLVEWATEKESEQQRSESSTGQDSRRPEKIFLALLQAGTIDSLNAATILATSAKQNERFEQFINDYLETLEGEAAERLRNFIRR